MPKRKKPVLTDKQQKYVEERAKGSSQSRSAIAAGYVPDRGNVGKLENSKSVSETLAEIRKELAENKGITKEQVIDMLTDAADMARVLGDPAGLVAAAREIGKMLGFYAPEVRKTLHSLDSKELKKALSELSDEELLRLSHAKVIDGTAERVRELPPPQDV